MKARITVDLPVELVEWEQYCEKKKISRNMLIEAGSRNIKRNRKRRLIKEADKYDSNQMEGKHKANRAGDRW